MTKRTDDARLHLLDGLRGLAALLVVVFHFNVVGPPTLPSAFLAVDFFFVLSGLVIARAYAGKLSRGMTPWRFMQARLLRLYPLFAVGMGIGLARELAKIAIHDPDSMSAGHLLAATLSAALMLPDPRMPGMLYPLDPPAWSLFFELLINAAFAWWLVRARTGTLALILLAALAGLFAGAAIQDSMNQGSFWDGFPTGIARVTSMFTAGVLITRLSRPAFRRRSWWTLVPLAAFVAVLAMPFQNPPWLVHAGLVAIGAPALVWCGTRFEVPATATRLCGWLGDISYPVYLIHTPLIFAWHMAARRLHMPWLGEIAGFVAFVAAFGTVLALADTRLRAMLAARLHVRRSAPLQTVAD